jgi:hypothetical protein
MRKLVDMCATEATEAIQNVRNEEGFPLDKTSTPLLKYNLELLSVKDGSLYWVE